MTTETVTHVLVAAFSTLETHPDIMAPVARLDGENIAFWEEEVRAGENPEQAAERCLNTHILNGRFALEAHNLFATTVSRAGEKVHQMFSLPWVIPAHKLAKGVALVTPETEHSPTRESLRALAKAPQALRRTMLFKAPPCMEKACA